MIINNLNYQNRFQVRNSNGSFFFVEVIPIF